MVAMARGSSTRRPCTGTSVFTPVFCPPARGNRSGTPNSGHQPLEQHMQNQKHQQQPQNRHSARQQHAPRSKDIPSICSLQHAPSHWRSTPSRLYKRPPPSRPPGADEPVLPRGRGVRAWLVARVTANETSPHRRSLRNATFFARQSPPQRPRAVRVRGRDNLTQPHAHGAAKLTDANPCFPRGRFFPTRAWWPVRRYELPPPLPLAIVGGAG